MIVECIECGENGRSIIFYSIEEFMREHRKETKHRKFSIDFIDD